ncbi:MAG: hypothetical protein JWQ73_808, partial [Variovorax sp.]|nr:hypothetical protein [Variovorax sp.]
MHHRIHFVSNLVQHCCPGHRVAPPLQQASAIPCKTGSSFSLEEQIGYNFSPMLAQRLHSQSHGID